LHPVKGTDGGDGAAAPRNGEPGLTAHATVFVSYPRDQAEFVKSLTEALDAREISSWVDLHGIPPASPQWREDMRAAVRGHDAFVCVMSAAAVRSEACLEEMRYATELRKKLIVLQREDPGDVGQVPAAITASNWIQAGPEHPLEDILTAVQLALLVEYEWTTLRTRLQVLANDWRASGQSRSHLLVGDHLVDMERAIEKHGSSQLQPALEPERELVAASRRAASRGRRWRTVITLAVIAGLTTLAVFALIQRSQAIGQRDTAISRELATSSAERVESDPALAVTLARLAVERRRTPQAEFALQRTLIASHIAQTLLPQRPTRPGLPIALSAKARTVVLADGANVDSHIIDLYSHRDVVVSRGADNGGGLDFAQFSRDGRRLLTIDYDQRVTVWATRPTRMLGTWHMGNVTLTQAVFAGDRVWLVANDGDVFVYSIQGQRLPTPALLANGHVIGISDDARTLLQHGHNATLLLTSAGRRTQLSRRGRDVTAAFAQDGSRVAITFAGQTELWSVRRPHRIMAAAPGVTAFSDDSRGFLDVGNDGILRRYDARTGRLTRSVPGFPGDAAALAPVGSADDQAIVADANAQVAVWDTRSRSAPLARYVFERRQTDNGHLLANGRAYSLGVGEQPNSQVLSLWDVRDGSLVARRALPAQGGALSVAPSGRFVGMSTPAGRVAVVPVGAGQVRDVQGGAAAFSYDGRHLIVGGPRRVTWFGLPGLDREGSFKTNVRDATELEVSADGRRLMVTDIARTVVYDWPSGHEEFELSKDLPAFAQALTADGGLAAIQSGPTVRIESGANGRLVHVYPPVKAGALSPFGDVVAIADDRNLTLWNAVAAERIQTFPLPRPAAAVSFSPDGGTVMVVDNDGGSAIYPCSVCRPVDALLRDAKLRVARRLTAAERASYLSG
jgi:WD40 repeat protein